MRNPFKVLQDYLRGEDLKDHMVDFDLDRWRKDHQAQIEEMRGRTKTIQDLTSQIHEAQQEIEANAQE